MREKLLPSRRLLLATLLGLLLLLLAPGSRARAATLSDAVTSLFSQLEDNLFGQGKIVAVMKAENEVIVEFTEGAVPHAGAELLIYDEHDRDLHKPQKAFTRRYKGVIAVLEAGGRVARAQIVREDQPFAEGDTARLPVPIMVFITPVQNLTGYPPFTAEATQLISLQVGKRPTLKIEGLQRVDGQVLSQLQSRLRQAGRYGLIIQPYLVTVNGQSKAELKLISLFSGQSLGVLSEDFFAFPAGGMPVPVPYPGRPPLQPYPGSRMPATPPPAGVPLSR